MPPRLPLVFAPLCVIAVALPFLFSVTDAPTANFWPLLASWLCGGVLLAVAALEGAGAREAWARRLALGLAVAAVVGAVIGLAQYVAGDLGLSPWVHASVPGQAVGNLRQRNQQASLLSLGAWALLWWTLHGTGWLRRRQGLVNVLVAVALVWIALASAATASRTGALQWLLVLGLLLAWRRTGAGAPLRLALAVLLVFVAASWVLPELLWRLEGVRADALFHRFGTDSHMCTSRRVLWSNMLTLIAQKPWLGWGWGELDYAHYVTLFPGERFCVLLDNAHNLPLHLAVELGLPVALAVCAFVLWAVWRFKPWRETDGARQLAWGALALIGMHSMLEFPLWYGPFQLVAVIAIAILVLPVKPVELSARTATRRQVALLVSCAAWLVGAYWISSDFSRMAALYQAPQHREAQWRHPTAREVSEDSEFFTDQAEFAWLTTTTVTAENAVQMHAMARRMLHYSPEPRVITKLIESSRLLGADSEANEHMALLQKAYPDAYKAFVDKQPLPASSH